MNLRILKKIGQIIVLSDAEGFSSALRCSRSYQREGHSVVPIQSERESLRLLRKAEKILLVIDLRRELSPFEESFVHAALSGGAQWCPLSVFEGLHRGFVAPQNLRELLEWVQFREDSIFGAIKARLACISRRCAAIVLGLILLPVMVLIAAGIKWTSAGPVFFVQTRVGHNGRQFNLIKFRTMHIDAEDGGPQWCSGHSDSRIFPLGRFLRRTHLDEIPQLWNVIRGDLCFVGPRPERPEFVEVLKKHIPHFPIRSRVKPGLTGWAQLKSGYAASVEESRAKISHDLFYMSSKDSVLILKIFMMTIMKCCREVFSSILVLTFRRNQEIQ